MSHAIILENTGELGCSQLEAVIRPVGAFRFLTPLDVVRKGDLFRCVMLPGAELDGFEAYDHNWSLVTDEACGAGKMVSEQPPAREFIRPVSQEESAMVPLFDLSKI